MHVFVGIVDVFVGECCIDFVPLRRFGRGFFLLASLESVRGIFYPYGSVIRRFLVVPGVGGRHGWW